MGEECLSDRMRLQYVESRAHVVRRTTAQSPQRGKTERLRCKQIARVWRRSRHVVAWRLVESDRDDWARAQFDGREAYRLMGRRERRRKESDGDADAAALQSGE